MENPQTNECVMTLNTCQTADLRDRGWVPTESGNCEQTTLPPLEICGPGGTAMVNPQTNECVMTLNTCETADLAELGWQPSASGSCQ